MKLKLLILTSILFLSFSCGVSGASGNSSIYILFDFSSSYHNPDDQALVIKNEEVLSKLDTFIRNLYPTLPPPTTLTVIPIREVGLTGGSVHKFCLNMSVFAQKNSSCVSKKKDLDAELLEMQVRIKKSKAYGNTDISGALKQTELYLKSQPNNQENIIVILSDMDEHKMQGTTFSDFSLPKSKVLIVWRSVFGGTNTDADVERINTWIEKFKSVGAKKVLGQYEEGFWDTESVDDLR